MRGGTAQTQEAQPRPHSYTEGMQAMAFRRSLRFVVLLVFIASCAAGIRAFQTARKYPSPSPTPHVAVPDDELTEHSIGGGPEGGEVYSLAIVRTQPATVFAALAPGGVFKSSDRGANWTPADSGLPQAWPCALVADPINTATLYAHCLNDLFKTTNGGATWQQLDVDDAEPPTIAPSDSRILYEPPSPSSIVRSADGGRHWTEVKTSGLSNGAECFAVDPHNAFVVYASSSDGIFESRDGGVRWTPAGPGWPAEIVTIAFDPVNDGIAYIGTHGGALYKSTTGGATWVRAGDGLPDGLISAIAVRGAASELLYAQVDRKLLRSTDAGDHWQPIDDRLPHQLSGGFAVDPWSPSILYAGTDAGVFVTTDGGARWTLANSGIRRMNVYELAVQEGKPSTLFVSGNVGIFSSIDSGGPWRHLDAAAPFAESDVERLESDGKGGVVVQTKSKLRFARPRGKTDWSPAPALRVPDGMTLIWSTPVNRAAIYAATRDSLLTTTSEGLRWRAVSLPNGRIPMSLAFAPRDPLVAYAGAADIFGPRTVWRTANGGDKWEQVDVCTDSLVTGACEPLFVDPNDANTVFVAVTGYLSGGYSMRRTVDGGLTWIPVDLPGIVARAVVLPTTPTAVFVEVSEGSEGELVLLKSVDRGEHWGKSSGLPADTSISDIIVDPADLKHLFAGTGGRGVFESRDGGGTWQPRR